MLKDWLRSLTFRELVALGTGAVFLLGTALFLLLEPALQERARIRGELPELRSDLRWMGNHAKEIQRLRAREKSSQGAGEGALDPAAVERSLNRAELGDFLANLEPVDGGGVRVRLKGAPFPEVLAWLRDLKARQGGTVVSRAGIQRSGKESGTVQARVTLVRRQGP